MANYKPILRYSLEIEKIKNNHYPSFEEIIAFLGSHEMQVSNRTLQRDLETIRYDFGLVIEYDRDKNGYAINYDVSINAEAFFRFLEIVGTADLLTSSIQENSNTLGLISFDISSQLKGIDQLNPILTAIKNKRVISFDHYNFMRKETKKYNIHPYLLKEYQNRWYVIGIKHGSDQYRTFGIDRIENLEVLPETFVPSSKKDPHEEFGHVIGLVYSDHKLQKVVLSFTAEQGQYINTLPWHTSQKKIVDNEEEYRISLDIKPNYELTQKILMHGSTVKVLEPAWLVDEVKAKLKEAIDQY